MKKTQVILLSFLMLGFISKSELFIRYNNAGYAPNSQKKIIILSDENLEGKSYQVKGHNNLTGTINKSESGVSLHTPFPFNHILDLSHLKELGEYSLTVENETINFGIKESPYSFLASDILRYFRVQRSFSKNALDHKLSHRGDKRCTIHRRENDKNDSWKLVDELEKKVDVSGGWYDAGDYIKFTLTTAHSAYNMLSAYEINPELFNHKKYSKTDFVDLLDEASWGLEFLMKISEKEDEFIIQVAGFKDHQEKHRLPEYDELNNYRECYSAFSATQMGYTAATLALGAQVFKETDPELAKRYADRAKRIYERAKYIENCAWVKQGWETFYNDKTPFDNLMLASVELYKLTQEEKYKNDAEVFSNKAGRAYWTGWGNANVLANIKANHFLGLETSYGLEDLKYLKNIAEEEGNVWKLPHKYTWSSLYCFMATGSASALNYYYTKDTTYLQNFHSVLNYSLGKNNWGMSFFSSKEIPNSTENIYSQIYILQPKLYPTGAIAEGPGDRSTHERLKTYFKLPDNNPFEQFNSAGAVFYDYETNFQTMETTIVGLGEGLLFIALADKLL